MIKMIVFDVDGTLTDGKIYIGPKGEVMKVFSAKDGYAIANLKKHGIIPVIITGRKSEIVEVRAKELSIEEVYQDILNKKEKLQEILNQYHYSWSEVAYVGDDIPDLEAMRSCGFKACPNDAVTEIKQVCDYVSTKDGGYGAVREIIDRIIEKQINRK